MRVSDRKPQEVVRSARASPHVLRVARSASGPIRAAVERGSSVELAEARAATRRRADRPTSPGGGAMTTLSVRFR